MHTFTWPRLGKILFNTEKERWVSKNLHLQVRIQCEPGGQLIIAGEPEEPNNPWGLTSFKKVRNCWSCFSCFNWMSNVSFYIACRSLTCHYQLMQVKHQQYLLFVDSFLSPCRMIKVHIPNIRHPKKLTIVTINWVTLVGKLGKDFKLIQCGRYAKMVLFMYINWHHLHRIKGIACICVEHEPIKINSYPVWTNLQFCMLDWYQCQVFACTHKSIILLHNFIYDFLDCYNFIIVQK